MRDFSRSFPFGSQAAEAADMDAPEVTTGLVEVAAELKRASRELPAGLLAAAVLAESEAWLDAALADSFPASDPISSNRYN